MLENIYESKACIGGLLVPTSAVFFFFFLFWHELGVSLKVEGWSDYHVGAVVFFLLLL